eukprot:CAMPEP_0119114080 /NCGR_PEP_ID=MMETSP1180-20130426/46113_1 /TAXON_ID=3052 ORGANISM="Chlamydomonas cf sp, Strain CCMP681" /NCGR_SAMPLE_ID=MMETSP1180 /ASSEMBLY_ACC=CAM_ASM_000741 /LENGTH=106 /DNA_ID=CAMNT_0007102441 /DNA_START=163 /DNA_END=484 /DNA_ORIENTATION=+
MTPPLKLCAIEPRASIQPQAMSSTCAWEEWRSQHYSPHVGTLRLMFSNGGQLALDFRVASLQRFSSFPLASSQFFLKSPQYPRQQAETASSSGPTGERSSQDAHQG